MRSLNLIIPFLQSNKSILIIYLFFSILSYPLESIIIPNILGSFFSKIKNNSEIGDYQLFFLKAIFFMLIINISYSALNYLDSIIIPTFNEYIINYIFKRILLNYKNYYSDIELGRLIARLNSIPSIIRELTTDLFSWLFPRFISIIVINIYFLLIDPILGLISISLLIIIIIYNLYNIIKSISISEKRYIEYENRAEEIQDKLSNLFSIYAAANTDKEIDDFKKTNEEYRKSYSKSFLISSKLKYMNHIFQCILFITLNGYIIYLLINKKITFDKLISLNMIISYYLPCISTIITSLPDYTLHIGALTALQDFFKLLENTEIKKPNIKINIGNISIKNLIFKYNDKLLFDNLNLEIKAGEKIAIIGESGNGKSSLIKLIMGYFPSSGIKIDEQDINEYDLDNLRSQITYINQNNKLFNNTVYYNIQYGNNLTKEDIDKLYDKFKLDGLFSNLENKFETNVGVNGDKLSGGQKQLVHILRAFGKKSKIYILDEPTSSIDPKNIEIVLKILTELINDSTLILITHDMNNLKIVNRIIKLQNGKIISDQNKI